MQSPFGPSPLQVSDPSVAIGALCLLIGGGLFALHYHSRRRGAETETWPTTDGRVTHAKRRHDAPYVEYGYEVDGRRYENNTVWPGSNATTVDGARGMVDENQPGSTTTVHYDPEDPGSAVVYVGVPPNRTLFAFASLLTLAGVGLLAFW